MNGNSPEQPGMSEVTEILTALERGECHAAEDLLPLVYAELRRLAAQKLAREKPGQTLQATALVHEAWLRLAGAQQEGNESRWDGSGLATPINPSGNSAELSHIDFCYDNACFCNDDGNECTAEICETDECLHIYLPPGAECSIGECDGFGNCGVPTPVPEFPSLPLPAAFIIGIIGLVYVIRVRGN